MKKISRNFFEIVKKILEPVCSSKVYFVPYFILEVFDGFQSVFTVVIFTRIIDAIELNDLDLLYFWIYIFLIIIFIKFMGQLFGDSLYSGHLERANNFLHKKYLEKYVKLNNTEAEKYGTGKLINIMFSGIENNLGLIKFLVSIFVEIGSILYIFYIILSKLSNFYHFLLFIVVFLLMIFFYWKGLDILRKTRENSKQYKIELSGLNTKILMSKYEILQNGNINKELGLIERIFKNREKLRFYGDLKKSFIQSFSEISLNLLYLFTFFVIGVGIINGKYSIASFTLFIWLIGIISKYTWQIRGYFKDFFKSYIEVQKLWDFFDNTPEIKGYDKGDKYKYKKGNIELKDITYSYSENKKVFDKFSLKIEGEKITALVGNSGGGKSTLVKLIAGYIDASSGELNIDGQNLRDVSLKSYYKEVGYLTQEPSVFDGTIIENLTYAISGELNEEKLKEIIELAKCEFIYDLPKGLETEIGEKGVRLSGGQRQRLAIAKIMLKDPKIIILDEPTSALDSFSEELITKAMNNLFKGRTVIVIAHRLQTVKHADRILVIEKWKSCRGMKS